MKTTVEISDPLLDRVRRLAADERSSIRALIEEGLRQVVESRARRRGPFKLRRASFAGKGLRPEASGGWDEIRDLTYSGRGG